MASVRFPQLIRTLSTSASASQKVKPPIQLFGLEGRYATALYSAATKMKQLDAVEKELDSIKSSLKTDLKFKDFVMDPSIKRSLKTDAVKQISTKLAYSAATGNLLGLLAENGRLNKLAQVINNFKIIMSAHRGEVICEVKTAKALDDAQRKNLEAALNKFLKANQVIKLTTVVDPTIIGGMIVSIADRYVDMSTASKINRYTEIIQAPA